MSFGARTSARASIREEKRMKEQEDELKKQEAKMKDDKKKRKQLLTMGLHRHSDFGAKPIYPDVEILDSTKDLNAPPHYMRHTFVSSRHSVAKGGRRTRKRRNGKRKTMRKGGRMRKGGGMRRRRYSSRNKRGGEP